MWVGWRWGDRLSMIAVKAILHIHINFIGTVCEKVERKLKYFQTILKIWKILYEKMDDIELFGQAKEMFCKGHTHF